jgi:hypothetical protein
MTDWNEVRARASAGLAWGRRLGAELGEFPDTLRLMREGAANFELVGRRLAAASGSLEEITALYESTIAISTRRTVDAAATLQSQIDALAATGSPERVASALRELQRSFESLAESNPFWSRTTPPSASDED